MNINKALRPGFSLIEIMIALTIMALIAAFVGPQFVKMLGRGERASTVNTLKVVKNEIKSYRMTVGKYPTKLEDLIVKPEGASGWDGPYVGDEDKANPEVPKDAWGQDLVYKLNPPGTKPQFELYSHGSDSKEDDRIDA